jgi:nitrite reductase/ring-hydroxylating ferredoxin subunit/uncharacterized membrane protein
MEETDMQLAASRTFRDGAIGRLLNRVVASIERQKTLDRVSEPIADVVHQVTAPGAVKNLLSGGWLGHQLHPVLTDLPIGFWTSALTLDMLGGEDAEAGADILVAAGNLSALGAAVSGLSDWSDLYGEPQRTGLIHAAVNVAALTFFTLSSAARAAGNRSAGKALAVAGGGTVYVAAYLGGHLVYRWGSGVIHSGFDTESNLSKWRKAMPETELVDGQPAKVEVHGEQVFLLKQDGHISALANHCVHMGGPLNEGEIDDGIVICPWHGSTFRIADGCVLRGPASIPQPVLETQVTDGVVEVRAAG